jgi:hypothetical protein
MQSEPKSGKATDSSAEESILAEVEGEQVFDLPPREALSIVDPGIFGTNPLLPTGRTGDQSPSPTDTVEPTDPAE